MHKEIIGNATLYLGDCKDVMVTIPDKSVDAVITDPPYGVNFIGKTTKNTVNRPSLVYDDSDENFEKNVMPAVKMAINKFGRAAIFCGNRRLHEYPKPKDIGGIICPSGAGCSSWGFSCFNPVVFYGTSPYLAKGLGSRPTAIVMNIPGMQVTGEKNEHPCPKPIAFMEWIVGIASLPQETVLDPFMGSGTTGVACMNLKRNFIGIEIEPKYFDIACKRIEDAQKQLSLFDMPEAKEPEQIEMFAG